MSVKSYKIILVKRAVCDDSKMAIITWKVKAEVTGFEKELYSTYARFNSCKIFIEHLQEASLIILTVFTSEPFSTSCFLSDIPLLTHPLTSPPT